MGACTALLGSLYLFVILVCLRQAAAFARRTWRPGLLWASAALAGMLLLTPAFLLGLLLGT